MILLFYVLIYGASLFFGVSFIIVGLPFGGSSKNVPAILWGTLLLVITILSIL